MIERTSAEAAPPSEITDLLRLAVEKGADVEALERLVGLYERVENRRAATELTAALLNFQADCPPVPHDATASFSTRAGSGMSYTYATLNRIRLTVNPILHPLGLSYAWDSEVSERVLVICTVRHVAGHSQTARFESPVDARNQALSGAQQHAGTLTFAKRQSLIQALGITTADEDLDGVVAADVITNPQYANLEDLITMTGADRAKFLDFFGIETLAKLPSNRLSEATRMLRAKARR